MVAGVDVHHWPVLCGRLYGRGGKVLQAVMYGCVCGVALQVNVTPLLELLLLLLLCPVVVPLPPAVSTLLQIVMVHQAVEAEESSFAASRPALQAAEVGGV